MARISKIGIKQIFKFSFFFYLTITFIFVLPVALITFLVGSTSKTQELFPFGGAVLGGLFFLILPVIYAVVGAIMVSISARLYNFIAKKVGGIEVEIEDDKEEKPKDSQTN